MIAAVREALQTALGATVARAEPVSGGDINEAFAVRLDDGRRVFVKTHRAAPAGMFAAEAHGLGWLAEANALRTPRVLAQGESFLALEFLDSRAPRPDFDETLGRGLATLHRTAPGRFGLERDNFIGSLPQSNRAHDTWADFYREERLGAQLEVARTKRRASAAMERGFERLFARLSELVGPPEPPARLHGDLWGGNLHVGPEGEPCLIDPAVYGGHREMDLAMMKLFGGFSPRVFSAYAEAFPLAPGHAKRVQFYQLYPLMVHVNLFGGGYASSVERILSAYA